MQVFVTIQDTCFLRSPGLDIVPASALPIQLPAQTREAAGDGLNASVPITHTGTHINLQAADFSLALALAAVGIQSQKLDGQSVIISSLSTFN